MARYPGFETTAEDAAELINLACWANAGCAVALADPASLSLAGTSRRRNACCTRALSQPLTITKTTTPCMKAVILAGGLGTRLAEETHLRPKPMVEIGGKPILWHILKTYSHYGINEFIICCGYKGYMIKEYFANYFLHTSDVTLHMDRNHMEIHNQNAEPWKVNLVDTGANTLTGGRLRRSDIRAENASRANDASPNTYGRHLKQVFEPQPPQLVYACQKQLISNFISLT